MSPTSTTPATCPRCGLPVTCKGRGRRPIWCSSTCRVEASIERKGNRLAGVEPRVVTVVREVSVKPTIPPWSITLKPPNSPEPTRPALPSTAQEDVRGVGRDPRITPEGVGERVRLRPRVERGGRSAQWRPRRLHASSHQAVTPDALSLSPRQLSSRCGTQPARVPLGFDTGPRLSPQPQVNPLSIAVTGPRKPASANTVKRSPDSPTT